LGGVPKKKRDASSLLSSRERAPAPCVRGRAAGPSHAGPNGGGWQHMLDRAALLRPVFFVE
jgi:hypothetical protein